MSPGAGIQACCGGACSLSRLFRIPGRSGLLAAGCPGPGRALPGLLGRWSFGAMSVPGWEPRSGLCSQCSVSRWSSACPLSWSRTSFGSTCWCWNGSERSRMWPFFQTPHDLVLRFQVIFQAVMLAAFPAFSRVFATKNADGQAQGTDLVVALGRLVTAAACGLAPDAVPVRRPPSWGGFTGPKCSRRFLALRSCPWVRCRWR